MTMPRNRSTESRRSRAGGALATTGPESSTADAFTGCNRDGVASRNDRWFAVDPTLVPIAERSEAEFTRSAGHSHWLDVARSTANSGRMKPPNVTRRSALKTIAVAAAVGVAGHAQQKTDGSPAAGAGHYRVTRGRLRQSVVPWCFNPMPVPELAGHAASIGLKSVELCDPRFWPALKEHGLTCAIAGSHGFAKGFARTEEHDECLTMLRKRIEECAAAGVDRVITFSGFRRGVSDEA